MNPPISIAILMLHPDCNMSCSFCVTENSLEEMSYRQAVDLLDTLKKRSISNIVLGGGEPFTWPHNLVRLAEEAKKKSFFVQVGTNGVDLPEHFEKLSCIDRFVLPLDAAESRRHNQMRFFKNKHHSIILDRLEQLRKAQKPVTISTVVTRENIDALPAIGLFLKDYCEKGGLLHAWHLYKFVPIGRQGAVHAEQLETSMEEYEQACQAVKQMNLGFTVYKRKDMFHSRSVEFYWREGGELKKTSG